MASATFINSAHPDSNNGGASLLYLGQDFEEGAMRGLIRFDLSPSLTGRITVTACTLSMTTSSLVLGTPAAATVYLERLTQSWDQGNGAGVDPFTGDYTYGSACAVSGATWNQPLCSGVAWSTVGGSVAGLSDFASAPASSGSLVQWKSSGAISDVQGWFDNPSSNYGWLLQSSTETTYDTVQAFEKNAPLSVSYACKIGFQETAGGCTTCTATAQDACVALQTGNTCNDSGPPSTTYSCTCDNAAYTTGPDGTSCIDKDECIPNQCIDLGDTQAVCTDHVAPATGYDCACSAGFVAIGGTCSDDIFGDGFDATSP